jgi:hypothetical protein
MQLWNPCKCYSTDELMNNLKLDVLWGWWTMKDTQTKWVAMVTINLDMKGEERIYNFVL